MIVIIDGRMKSVNTAAKTQALTMEINKMKKIVLLKSMTEW